jgi:hypothetical protein
VVDSRYPLIFPSGTTADSTLGSFTRHRSVAATPATVRLGFLLASLRYPGQWPSACVTDAHGSVSEITNLAIVPDQPALSSAVVAPGACSQSAATRPG